MSQNPDDEFADKILKIGGYAIVLFFIIIILVLLFRVLVWALAGFF